MTLETLMKTSCVT